MSEEIEELKERIENTERALMAAMTILIEMQPPDYQDRINELMKDFFIAQTSYGFNVGCNEFTRRRG